MHKSLGDINLLQQIKLWQVERIYYKYHKHCLPPFQNLLRRPKYLKVSILKKPSISLYTGVMLWRRDFQQLSRHLLSLAKYLVDKFL